MKEVELSEGKTVFLGVDSLGLPTVMVPYGYGVLSTLGNAVHQATYYPNYYANLAKYKAERGKLGTDGYEPEPEPETQPDNWARCSICSQETTIQFGDGVHLLISKLWNVYFCSECWDSLCGIVRDGEPDNDH